MVHEAFCLDSQGIYLWGKDEFLGDSIDARWKVVANSGGATVVDAQSGGVVRVGPGATLNHAARLDWGDIRTLLVSKKLTFEYHVKLNDITYIECYLGVWFDSSNFIYFLAYDDAGGAINWMLRCRDAGALTTQTSNLSVDSNYHIFKLECFPTGELHFYIDNVEVNVSPLTTNIPPDYLQPLLYLKTKEALAKSMDIDYVQWRQLI